MAVVHRSDLPELVVKPSTNDDQESERERRKAYLTAACRVFALEGFQIGVAGHITVRDPEHADRFWVNPLNISMRILKRRDLMCVDSNGTIIHGKHPISPSAIWIHAQLYRARPDVNAIVHMHSLYGRAFSTLHVPLAPTSVEACVFYEDHALYREFRGLAFSPEEGRDEGLEIAAALGNHHLLIECNHGLVTVGATAGAAIYRFLAADNACHEQLLARAAGDVQTMAPAAARQAHRQIGSEYACWLSFEPKYHEMLTLHPDILD